MRLRDRHRVRAQILAHGEAGNIGARHRERIHIGAGGVRIVYEKPVAFVEDMVEVHAPLVRTVLNRLRGHEEIRPGIGVRIKLYQVERSRIQKLSRNLIVRKRWPLR